ncbi:hypothetical protein NHQ30_004448 [Ciborinia camelliae]|nr:hypothetical protein NHQ30_004448 [Ciborinia camelliae]
MSSKQVLDQMTDRPSNPIHRLSEVLPRFEALRVASAVNHKKTEYRQGELLENLVKQKYPGNDADECIKSIRDNFASYNKRIRELHKRGPVATATGDEDAEMVVDANDDKDGNYNGDGGANSHRLTAEQEKEDEEHWNRTVNALPKRLTITDYYVEMGYQMGPFTPKEGLKEEPQEELEEESDEYILPLSRVARLAQPKHRVQKWTPVDRQKMDFIDALQPSNTSTQSNDAKPPKARAKKWAPSVRKKMELLVASQAPNSTPSFNAAPPFNNETINPMHGAQVSSASSPLMPPPPKRFRAEPSPSRPRHGPKKAPRCNTCMRMRKLCDRKTPCGRCIRTHQKGPCIPYEKDL